VDGAHDHMKGIGAELHSIRCALEAIE